jgi:hypothetical protein
VRVGYVVLTAGQRCELACSRCRAPAPTTGQLTSQQLPIGHEHNTAARASLPVSRVHNARQEQWTEKGRDHTAEIAWRNRPLGKFLPGQLVISPAVLPWNVTRSGGMRNRRIKLRVSKSAA